MAFSHHQPKGLGLGPKMNALIETVSPSKRIVQARLRDNTTIQIAVTTVPTTFSWPKEGEYWNVRKDGHHWKLDEKLDLKTDFPVESLSPGDARIAANEIYDTIGKHVVAVDDSNAVNNNIIIYNNNQWIVSSLSLNRYYGAFSDYTDQYGGGGASPGVANTAAPFTFNTTDENNGVSIVGGSKITFAHAGTYNVQWSGQFNNTSNALQDVSVWLRKNGVDPGVVGSTGLISIPNSHGGTDGHIIAGWNFVFTVTANDYYEFMWSTSSNAVTVQTYAVGTSPAKPSTASLVLTVTPVR